MDSAKLYDAAHERIVGLLTHADPTAPVHACPGWTVQDLAAHLSGELGAFVNRDFDAGEHENFGERIVAERRGQSIADSLAEWAAARETADAALESPMGAVLVAELVGHEQDLRTALNQPGARDDPAVRVALDRPLQELAKKLAADGLALRIVLDTDATVYGEGEPKATLTTSAYELGRVMGGRRTEEEVRALDWGGTDPGPYLPALKLFGSFRETSLEE
jgi:uncharacterized protein (TIGR03083 family)